MRKTAIFLFSLVTLCTASHAQVQNSGWLASFSTIGINDKWSVHFDAQFRSTDNIEHLQTILLRPGINYKVNDKIMLSGGYAYIPNRRTVNNVTGYVAENRFWQQAIYAYKWNKVSVSHRFRFEERYLPVATVSGNDLKVSDRNEAFRFRYFIRNVIPLTKKPAFTDGLFFALQNEVFLHTGNKANVNGKTFDQNRFYSAVGYRFSKKIDIEAGYMNQYVNTRTSHVNNHIAQLAVYKRL